MAVRLIANPLCTFCKLLPAVILASLALAGCTTTHTKAGATVHPQLPALPAKASADCANPVTKVGDDLGAAGLHWKATAICERGRKHALAGFYVDLRRRLSK